ncbi:MAG: LbtU family siderophore porin [bacterium]
MNFHTRCDKFSLFCFIITVMLFLPARELFAQEPAAAFSMGGAIEVEAGYIDIDPNNDTSILDINLATVELAFTRSIGNYSSVHLVFLREENATDKNFHVDEAALTMLDPLFNFPVYLTIGKTYLPFGIFTTNFITDPYTKKFGQIKEAGGVLVYNFEKMNLGLSAFKENELDLIESEERIVDYIVNLNVNNAGALPLSFGISYLSHISDTNGLQYCFSEKIVENHVSGINLYVDAQMGHLSCNAEFIGALDFIDYLYYIDSNDTNTLAKAQIEPYALNIELCLLTLSEQFLSGIKFEKCKYAKNQIIIQEYRYGAILSYALFEKTILGLEYLYEKRTYTNSLFDDDHQAHRITAQLAVLF